MADWLSEYYAHKAIVESTLNVTSAATVQQYFKYTYQSTVYNSADSGTFPASGFIRFNNGDTASATEAAIANLTSVAQGIGTYMTSQQAGVTMHVRSTQENKLGIYNIEAVPTTLSGHRKFTITAVNGLALTDGDEVTISFTSNANCIGDPTLGTITANGTQIGNTLAVDTIEDAISTVTVNAANDNKEFIVKDPGGNSANTFLEAYPWNLMVDNTAGKLRQMHGLSDFAMIKTANRYCQPAVNASAAVTDSSVLPTRTKLTITAHGLTALVAGTDTYVVVKTTANGWTAKERLKILSIVDTNNIVVDKLIAGITGSPTLYVITESMPVASILCPPLRTHSQLVFYVSAQIPTSANNKTISFNWGGTDYWAPSAFTTTKGVGRLIIIKNIGATDKQIGQGLASSNTGLDGIQTAGNVPTSAVNTLVVTEGVVNIALANAGEYFEIENLVASCRW